MHTLVQDPNRLLRKEAEVHVLAWLKLGYVLSPLGFLAAHDKTGTPAILVLEIGMCVQHERKRTRHYEYDSKLCCGNP